MKIKAGNLNDYLQSTLENSNDHAQENPQLMHMIYRMDKLFHEEIFDHEFDVNPVAGFLVMNSYMMLLSAVRQALSGHTVSVFPIMRTALESACYAFLAAHDEELCKVWLNRHKSKNALQKCREKFTAKKAANQLKNLSPEMAEYVMAHYEASIDFGAHPNQKSILNHLKDIVKVEEGFQGFELVGVYNRNSWNVNFALFACAEVGQAIAFLFAASSKNHPLIHERLNIFQEWINEKIRLADEFNNGCIEYDEEMYRSFAP